MTRGEKVWTRFKTTCWAGQRSGPGKSVFVSDSDRLRNSGDLDGGKRQRRNRVGFGIGVTGKEIIRTVDLVVDPDVKLVPVLLPGWIGHQVVGQRRRGRERVGIHQLCADRVKAVRLDDIAGKGISNESAGIIRIGPGGQRVVNDPGNLAEVPGAHPGGGDSIDESQRPTLAEEVNISEKEGPVFPDGPADRETELVLLERGNFIRGSVEEILRVQGRIAQEFVSRAVNFIGA